VDALAQLKSALSGRYAIDREIGAGGMATVYLARDVRHNRSVALKVLNPELGAVLGVERFLAEIQVTANLQHPNLLPLFDSGEAEGLLFYVMPYVEGESLRARLQREKQLPVDEAVRIATAICGALDYAHRNKVIHRDLKPENILLHEGQPLIADFGIALAVSNAGGARITQTGLSLGTPQYMSPEQATGDRVVDGRTDIYSLAAMTYEMLVGEPPHAGPTAQAIIAKLMTEEVRPLTVLRRSVPPQVDLAVRHALEKLPADRFATGHEFAEALHSRAIAAPAATPLASAETIAPSRGALARAWRTARPVVPWAVALLGLAVGAWGWTASRRAAPAPTVRFSLAFPGRQQLFAPTGSPVAISPDGRTLAYAATDSGGNVLLYVRAIDELQPRAIPNSFAPRFPVFSPDGRWIAFHGSTGLKKVSADGGPIVTLAELALPAGISWGTQGQIIVSSNGTLKVVSAQGGAFRDLVQADAKKGEFDVRWPLALPDGETVLYMSAGSTPGSVVSAASHIAAVSVKTGKVTHLDIPGTFPMGVLEGRLVYATPGVGLMAVPFDARRVRTTGSAVPLVEDVVIDVLGGARAALSASGSLIYESGRSVGHPVLVDADGRSVPLIREPREFSVPRYAPDGQRVAFTIGTATSQDVWIYALQSGTLTRLTTDGLNTRPEWSPDGKRVLFRSERAGRPGIWWQPADGSGPPEPLLQTDVDPFEAILSPDGRYLLFRTGPGVKYSRDILYITLGGDSTLKPLVTSLFNDMMPRLSPDGRWLAYQSNESGQNEIYVRPFPEAGGRVQVSTGGGIEPLWDRRGRALYYRRGQQLVAAAVTTTPTFSMGSQRALFEADYLTNPSHPNYDVAPDGAHFLMLKRMGEAQTVVVLNWIAEVRARTAAKAGR